MFEPAELTTLSSLARTGSFARAAEALGIAPSTVSLHVANLERDAGSRLVARGPGRSRDVELTPDGEALVQLAARALDARDRIVRRFAGSETVGRIRFAVADDLASLEFADALRGFRRRHPGVALEVTIGQSTPLTRRFRDGQFDVVFVKRHPSGPSGRVLMRDRFTWTGHPEVTIDQSEPLPLVLYPAASISRHAALKALNSIERPWRIANTVRGVNGAVTALRAGIGVGIMTTRLMPPDLVDVGAVLGLPPIGELDYVLLDHPHSAHEVVPELVDAVALACGDVPPNIV